MLGAAPRAQWDGCGETHAGKRGVKTMRKIGYWTVAAGLAILLLGVGASAKDLTANPAAAGARPVQVAEQTTCAQLGYSCVRGYNCRTLNPPRGIRKPDGYSWKFMCIPATNPRCPQGYAIRNAKANGSFTCEPIVRKKVRLVCPRGRRAIRIAGLQSFKCAATRATPNCRTPAHSAIMNAPVIQGRAYICRSGS